MGTSPKAGRETLPMLLAPYQAAMGSRQTKASGIWAHAFPHCSLLPLYLTIRSVLLSSGQLHLLQSRACFVLFCFGNRILTRPWLFWNFLYRPGRPEAHRYLCLQSAGIKRCATTPGYFYFIITGYPPLHQPLAVRKHLFYLLSTCADKCCWTQLSFHILVFDLSLPSQPTTN